MRTAGWRRGHPGSRRGPNAPTGRADGGNEQLGVLPVTILGRSGVIRRTFWRVTTTDPGPASLTGTAERFRGCLLGGAIGDALGAPVEFDSRTDILRRFGPDGIADYAAAYGGLGTITDDTQMTLFTAEGLIRGWVRLQVRGSVFYPTVVGHAYGRWLLTQGEHVRHGDVPPTGWLIDHRELHSRRAPGTTCLTALREVTEFGRPADNTSKGCGGVMRVAPVALLGRRVGVDAQEVFDLAAALAALTHGHPSGSLPAGVLAVVVFEAVAGASLSDAIAVAVDSLRTKEGHRETFAAVTDAVRQAESGVPAPEAIARLGAGWVAEEALAISLYCALTARDFAHGVTMAVNHSGDSDSTGAITGNLLGAALGASAIPRRWLEPLELRDVIGEIADDLSGCVGWDLEHGGDAEQWALERYPAY